MTRNTFDVDAAYPPPPPMPPVSGWPPLPPGPPPGNSQRHRRGWPVIVTAGVVSALVASTIAAVVTLHVRDTGTSASTSTAPSTVTTTVAAPEAPSPDPLPAAQADRQTCETRAAASRLIDEAAAAQGIIPQGMTISDPAVQADAAWRSGVEQAGRLYEQASTTLVVTPGATELLAEAVTTASKALHALGTAYTSFDPANGNAYRIAREASDAMDVLCGRI